MILNKCNRFFWQFKIDLKLWLYCVLLQQLWRIISIWQLKKYLATPGSNFDLIISCLYGLRFDSVWATITMFVSLLLITSPYTINSKIKLFKYRKHLGALFTFFTSVIYVSSIEYYKEYHDIFNQFVFGLIYDDTAAIISTILSEYNIIQHSFLILFFMVIYYTIIVKRFGFTIIKYNNQNIQYSTLQKTLYFSLILIFCVGAFRGGLGPRPIQLKDAAITRDNFLNKIIISPFSALKYAFKDYLDTLKNDNSNKFLSGRKIQTVLEEYKSSNNYLQENKLNFNKNKLDDYLLKKTKKNNKFNSPKHIFVIVGESLDSWSLQDKYKKLNLTNQIKKLASDGIFFYDFLPASDGTMKSLNTIITGMPDTGVITNYQKNSLTLYSTSPAGQFKNLGYSTNFFYGGYLSWQRIDSFSKIQGFDNVYGAPDIETWVNTTEWGVDDRSLFNFILKTVSNLDNQKQLTYNVIMTTSNHPPYKIDLKKEGFDFKEMEIVMQDYPDSPTSIKQLGHLWYSDKVIGEFVEEIEATLDNSLFAITGDHYGRRHILPNPPLYDISSVPLILYGKDVINKNNIDLSNINLIGSHLDLGVTLLELSAPDGFSYHSFGRNLLDFSYNKDNKNTNIAISKNASIYNNILISNVDLELPVNHDLKKYNDNLLSLAWWRIVKGNDV